MMMGSPEASYGSSNEPTFTFRYRLPSRPAPSTPETTGNTTDQPCATTMPITVKAAPPTIVPATIPCTAGLPPFRSPAFQAYFIHTGHRDSHNILNRININDHIIPAVYNYSLFTHIQQLIGYRVPECGEKDYPGLKPAPSFFDPVPFSFSIFGWFRAFPDMTRIYSGIKNPVNNNYHILSKNVQP